MNTDEREGKMKRISSILILLFLLGCIKTATKEIILPDQEIGKGNRGYLIGTAPKVTKHEVKKKKIFAVEVEIPSIGEVKTHPFTRDNEIWGNQGYIYKAQPKEFRIYYGEGETKRQLEQRIKPQKPKIEKKKLEKKEEIIPHREGEERHKEYIIYKVEKGESLWKIAKKFYQDPNKWVIIYEENKQKIKDPARIKSGLELRIPLLEKGEEKYIK
jgi:nucleoid-associated protein YgaU